MDVDIGFRDFQRLRELAGESGNVLRGKVREEMITVSPLGNGAVAFQAAVGDDRTAVNAFRNNFRFFEGCVGIAFDLLRLLLIRRVVRLRALSRERL